MSRTFHIAALLLLAIACCGYSHAALAVDVTPKAEFDHLYVEWKSLLVSLRQMRNEYQVTSGTQRTALEDRYRELVDRAKRIAPKLIAAAERAYLEAPNKDSAISDFLVANLVDNVQSDRFEAALRHSKLLLDHKYDNPRIYSFAGKAAFALHDFELAHNYLELAAKAGTLDDSAGAFIAEARPYQRYWKEEQAIREKEAKDDDLPRVEIKTTKGNIVVELFENEAPIATANFINLAEQGFYEGSPFHRVLPNFMAQGGDRPQKPANYDLPDECLRKDARRHFRGSLSMAKTEQPDSGNSQRSITFLPTPHLNGRHTVFGRVLSGWEVLPELTRIQPGENRTADRIIRATVLRKRDHKYVPVKLPPK